MSDSSADRDPLDRLAEEFVARLRRGEHPSIDDYAARAPELAEQVRELFPALVEMEQLKPAAGELTGAYGAAAEPGDPPRVGEFRILRRVGVGGMGVVYEAVQESLGRHVALKLLPAEAVADPRRLERFRREARAAARLHHTNIVPVFGVGEADGRHYYAMQYIPGHPLDAVVAEVRRLKDKSAPPPAVSRAVTEVAGALVSGSFAGAAPAAGSSPALSGSVSSGGSGYWATVARIGAQVADALAYAHGQGVLHRDVKPANLLLDPTGTVWVADFGLAKSADADDLTHAGDIVGTLRYMAPERFDGAGDARADVYALGLTLYELLTLRPAFAAENRARLVQEVTAANPPRPRSVSPTIPRDLETIVLKATARDPGARYQSAAAMGDDLRRFLDGRTITARRVGSVERLWRWAKRAPAVAALLVLTGVLLAAGATVSTVFAVRADAERRDANQARQDATDRADDLRAEQEATAALLYASESHQASTAAHEYRTARLLELLEGMRPKAGRPDLRGWEWHYLRRLADPWPAAVRIDAAGVPGFTAGRGENGSHIGIGGGTGPSTGAAFTADGSRLVVPPDYAPAPGGFGSGPSVAVPGGVFDTRTGRAVAAVRPPAKGEFRHTGVFGAYQAACAISPDGRFLAHAEPVFEPVPPGRDAGVTGYKVKVTDLETGREATPPLDVPGPYPGLVAMAVGPGANRVVALLAFMGDTGEPRAVVWDRGRGVRTIDLRHPGRDAKLRPSIDNWALSPDGSTAAVTFAEPVEIAAPGGQSPGRGALEVHTLAGPDAPPRVFASAAGLAQPTFSAGGTALALWEGLDGRTVVTADARTGRWVGRWALPTALPLVADTSPGLYSPLAVSDDGRRAATDTGFGLLVVGELARLEAAEGTVAGRWRTAVIRRPILPDEGSLAFPRVWLAADGSRVRTAGGDGTLRTLPLDPFPGFAVTWPDVLPVDGIACGPRPGGRGRWVVYASYNATHERLPPPRPGGHPIGLYDTAAGRLARTDPVPGNDVSSSGVTADGRRVLVVASDLRTPAGVGTKSIHLLALDRPAAAPLLTRPYPQPAGSVSSSAPRLSAGGRWLVEPAYPATSAAPDPTAGPYGQFVSPVRYRFFSTETGAAAGTIPPGPRDWDGLAHAEPLDSADDRVVLVFNHPAGKAVHPERPPPVPVTARGYDPATGRQLWAWAVPDPVPFARRYSGTPYWPVLPVAGFAPDGRVAVAWQTDRGAVRVRLLDAATGAEGADYRADPADGWAGPALTSPVAVAFGPGGRLAVGDGREVVVWDTPGAAAVRLRGHDQEVTAGVFSADGRRLFTLEGVVSNRLIHVWDVATRREVLTLREPPAGSSRGTAGAANRDQLWLDGDRLMLLTQGGVLAFDGTPRPE